MNELKYCSLCGKALVFKTLFDGSSERYCPQCDHVYFDTPSPAVIVAVTAGNRVLLARSVSWVHPYWGLIAGHVKSDETAEDAVVREIREEASLEIFDLKILGTYIWNKNLMIGFTAKTNSVNVSKSKELGDIAWFKLDESLPLRPNSIANQVIRKITLERG